MNISTYLCPTTTTYSLYNISDFYPFYPKFSAKYDTKINTLCNRQFRKGTVSDCFSLHQIGVTSVLVFLGLGLLLNRINNKSMTSRSPQGFDGSQLVLVFFKRSQAVMPCGPYSGPFCNFINMRQGFKRICIGNYPVHQKFLAHTA